MVLPLKNCTQLLFVCPSNRALSPFLEHYIAKQLGDSRITVSSAGSFIRTAGEGVDTRAKRTAKQQFEVDLATHKTTPLTQELLAGSGLVVITFDQDSHWEAESKCGEGVLLRSALEFQKNQARSSLPDPVTGEIGFEEAFQICAEIGNEILRWI